MTREEAVKEIIRAYDVLDFSCHMDNHRKEAFNMAKVALEQEPKTGHWKRRIIDSGYNADWKCSECGHKEMTDFPTNYCPNCGCRMVEPQESEEV